MTRHCNWRDCQAWKDEGLEMSSTSNEAVKLYDASLTQLVAWYQDKSVGGFTNSMKNMLQADDTFLMGHVLKNGMRLLSTDAKSPVLDPSVETDLNTLIKLADAPTANPREKLHVQAIERLAKGRITDALKVWEEILLDYPTDMHAIKCCEMGYFTVGDKIQQRDSKYRILPHWNPSLPLYSYLYGMQAFGEVESGAYDRAERSARKGFELNPLDGWSIHALSHVLDETGRYNEGIDLVTSRMDDWTTNDNIACHIHWHLGLFYIEKGDFDAAIHHVDSQLTKYSSNLFHGQDRASILFRLEMEGLGGQMIMKDTSNLKSLNVGDRWSDTYELFREHLDDHSSNFSNMHSLIACIGAKHRQAGEDMLESIRAFVKNWSAQTDYRRSAERVGIPLSEALLAWDSQDFGRATDLLKPIRYEKHIIAGSNAQLDVINQLLIHSAMRSPEKRHKSLARALINERKAQKDTPLNDRLLEKLLSNHDD